LVAVFGRVSKATPRGVDEKGDGREVGAAGGEGDGKTRRKTSQKLVSK